MGYFGKWAVALVVTAAALICAACGQPVPPLESPLLPTFTPINSSTPTLVPSVTLTPTPGPSPTPDMRETSDSVFATITAMAATPTYPPTSTPRPRRTPIGAGPEMNDIPPTALYSSGGIAVQTISPQVYPGGAAALTIQTTRAAVCTLQVDRSNGGTQRIEPIPGIATRVAGKDGVVAWIWTVDAGEPAGIMRLIVNCGAAGKANLQLRVTR